MGLHARAVILEDVRIGGALETTGIDTARWLLTSGRANSHVTDDSLLIHGYALLKTTYIAVLGEMECPPLAHGHRRRGSDVQWADRARGRDLARAD